MTNLVPQSIKKVEGDTKILIKLVQAISTASHAELHRAPGIGGRNFAIFALQRERCHERVQKRKEKNG